MRWLLSFLGWRKPLRCAEAQCWLPATKRHAGHWFCDTHHHDYTYDVGITGKKYGN